MSEQLRLPAVAKGSMQKRKRNIAEKLKPIIMLSLVIAMPLMVTPAPAEACDNCSCWGDPDHEGETWYLRGDNQLSHEKSDWLFQQRYIYQGKDAWWYSEPAVGEIIYPDEDHWTLWLRYYNSIGNKGDLTATLYAVESDTATDGILLAENTFTVPTSWLSQCIGLDLPDNEATSQVIPDGYRLALKLSYNGCGMFVLYDSSYACSRLEGAAPVPEWSTIAMMGLGLAGLAGFVVLRRRKHSEAKNV